MEVNYTIYLMIDSHGNKESVIVNDIYNIVQILGMKNKEGDRKHFESEAYHTPTFCKENNIELKIINRKDYFDDLWNS